MSETKIDWTKPLRVVETHELVRVDGINPNRAWPYVIRIWEMGGVRTGSGEADRDGRAQVQNANGVFRSITVENVPPEPRIVKRWAYVTPVTLRSDEFGVEYSLPLQPAQRSEIKTLPPGTLLARVLIEEPGE